MQINARHHFDAAPARVYAMVTDPDFLNSACVQMGTRSHQVDVAARGSGAHTRTVTGVDAPSLVRRFVGDVLTVSQAMTWGAPQADGGRTADLEITVAGMPVRLIGRAVLSGDESGTDVVYDGELTVPIPFVGPTIEKQAAPEILQVLQSQELIGREWLRARS